MKRFINKKLYDTEKDNYVVSFKNYNRNGAVLSYYKVFQKRSDKSLYMQKYNVGYPRDYETGGIILLKPENLNDCLKQCETWIERATVETYFKMWTGEEEVNTL